MALKLKEFDFKGFLLERGERVGLYAAGGLALLIVVLSLFLPGKGVWSPSPRKGAKDMDDLAASKKSAVINSKPTDTEVVELSKVPTELQKQASSVAEDAGEFRFAGELFAPREIPSNKRQNPNVFAPEEFLAAVVDAQVSNYMILNERDGVRLGVIEGTTRDTKGKSPFDRMKDMFGGGRGGPGKPGGPGMGGPSGPGMPGGLGGSGDSRNRGNMGGFGPGMPGPPGGGGPAGGAPFGDDKKNVQITYLRKDELASKPNAVFARDLLPVPMAVIVGSFPLKAQIDEFKNALRADSAYNVVFQETVGEKDKPRRAFEFLGFQVERKTYGPDGKVVKGLNDNEWQELDVTGPNSAYIATVAQVLQEFAPEDPKVAPLMVRGLYLPRPVQIPVKQGQGTVAKEYPKIEEELPKIKDTLEKIKDKEPKPIVPPSKFDDASGFNPFADPDAEKAGPNDGKNMPTASEWSPPEYCVMRFLDLTIQPGQTYEYRVKIRMRNPNWNKPESEVANKQLTVPPELTSEWKPITRPGGTEMLHISVPTDLHLYAVDEQQAEVEEGKAKKDYKGMHANATYDASKQVPVQIHKWMGMYELRRKPTAFFPVGDWVVGERIFATRGELVGVKEVATHVPVWSPEQSQFTLAGRPPPRARGADTRPTADVGFLEARRAPLLVDFDGGNVTYRHAAPPPKNEDGSPAEGVKAPPPTEVKGVAGEEILLLMPDGKLLGRAAARDQYDEARRNREKEYTDRVDNAEIKDTPATTGGKPGDPFGGGKP
jgi:hypothetical protein